MAPGLGTTSYVVYREHMLQESDVPFRAFGILRDFCLC